MRASISNSGAPQGASAAIESDDDDGNDEQTNLAGNHQPPCLLCVEKEREREMGEARVVRRRRPSSAEI